MGCPCFAIGCYEIISFSWSDAASVAITKLLLSFKNKMMLCTDEAENLKHSNELYILYKK
jgi:hypothetical protein